MAQVPGGGGAIPLAQLALLAHLHHLLAGRSRQRQRTAVPGPIRQRPPYQPPGGKSFGQGIDERGPTPLAGRFSQVGAAFAGGRMAAPRADFPRPIGPPPEAVPRWGPPLPATQPWPTGPPQTGWRDRVINAPFPQPLPPLGRSLPTPATLSPPTRASLLAGLTAARAAVQRPLPPPRPLHQQLVAHQRGQFQPYRRPRPAPIPLRTAVPY